MHDQIHHPSPDPIEAMPAAPEADPGTRDADAPTWSAPTDGHPDLPLSSAAPSDEAGGPEVGASDTTAAAEMPALISGDTIQVNQGGAQRIEGRDITINQGGAAIIRGDHVTVAQGGAAIIAARRVDFRDGGAFIVLARRVSGDVTAVLDWRGIVALFVGLVALLVVRGRR